MAYGMQGSLQYNFQNSYGTSNVASLEGIPIISEGLAHTIEQITEGGMYGRFYAGPDHQGIKQWAGDVAFEPKPASLGFWLKGVFGQVATTSDTAEQVHVFEPAASDFDAKAALPPLSLLVDRNTTEANCGFNYFDGVINTLALDIQQGQLMKCTASLLGGGFTQSALQAPTFPTDNPWAWDVASASFAGSPIEDVRGLTFTINNNVAPSFTLSNSKTPSRLKRTDFSSVEVAGTVVFESNSLHQYFLDGTEANLTVNLKHPTSPHNLEIQVPLARMSEWSPTMDGAGQIEVSLNMKAKYSVSSQTPIRITLTNTTEAY